jgi:hypothetical protein
MDGSSGVPGAPEAFRPRTPNPMTYEAALTISGPSRPSSSTSICGAMAEYHVSGSTDAGGAASRLLARVRASCVMFAPFICGTAASETLTVLEGWTAKTTSSVARTPSGRSGTRVSFSISLLRSHGGTWPGVTRMLSAARTLSVLDLGYASDLEGPQRTGWLAAYLSIRSSKSRVACALELSGTSGLKALVPASMMDCINFWRRLVSCAL